MCLGAPAASGEASSENDLEQNSTIKFLHGQSDAPRLAARLQAPAAGAWDPLARLAGAEAGLQHKWARSAIA